MNNLQSRRKFDWKFWVPRLVIISISICIVLIGFIYCAWFKDQFKHLLGWIVEHPLQGPFIICIVTIFLVVGLGSYALFAVGCGYALSKAYSSVLVTLTVGTFSVFIGAWLGAMIAFPVGRYICRDQIRSYSMKRPILRAIDSTMETQGLKLILLLRLSLLVPFNVSNYVLGISAVNYKDFAIGTIGLFPIVLFFTYIGTTMSNIHEAVNGNSKMTPLEIVVMVLGTLVALMGLIYTTCLVRETLNTEIQRQRLLESIELQETIK